MSTAREMRARRAASRQGLRLWKVRTASHGYRAHGPYGLRDPATSSVVASRLDLDEVLAWLCERAVDGAPTDGVTLAEAARILGTSTSSTRRHLLAGRLSSHGGSYQERRLSRSDVEALAAEVYPWWKHLDDATSYWVTGHAAAAILGVSQQRLDQLARADRIPFVRHRDGTRLYRRAQLETVANARDARWH